MESIFLNHAACPKCGPVQDRAGNNLGVYSDGHRWCFACGYYVPPTQATLSDLKRRMTSGSFVMPRMASLPIDASTFLAQDAQAWLEKYQITKEEIKKYKLLWSPMFHRLIIPIFNEKKEPILWQGRYFADPVSPAALRSKYWTAGQPGQVDAYFGDIGLEVPEKICVVEDFVSAIKVGRHIPTLCLWGSELSLERIRRLSMRNHKKLVIWLDYDKALYAARTASKASAYFDRVTEVISIKDPKDHSDEAICKWINN